MCQILARPQHTVINEADVFLPNKLYSLSTGDVNEITTRSNDNCEKCRGEEVQVFMRMRVVGGLDLRRGPRKAS